MKLNCCGDLNEVIDLDDSTTPLLESYWQRSVQWKDKTSDEKDRLLDHDWCQEQHKRQAELIWSLWDWLYDRYQFQYLAHRDQ